MTNAVMIEDANRYAVFVDGVARGFDPEDAARLAGLPQPGRTARALMQQPAVRKALMAACAARLEGDLLPLALAKAGEILRDAKTPAAVAAKLALGVIDRAGLAAPQPNQPKSLDDLENLTVEDLEAIVQAPGSGEGGQPIRLITHDNQDNE